MSLVVEHLSKKFGDHVAVEDLSFSIEKPGVFAFLGTNGAGCCLLFYSQGLVLAFAFGSNIIRL